jgi:hypothetical protein
MKKYLISLLLLAFTLGLNGCYSVLPVNVKNGLFSDGLVAVQKNGKYGFVNDKGRMVLDFEYDMPARFVNGFAVERKGSDYFLIDTLGNVIDLEVKYDFLKMDEETGLIWFRKDQKYGLLNNKGQMLVDNRFDIIYSFSEEVARVHDSEGFYYINTEGDMVGDQKYSFSFDFSDGLGGVAVNNKFGFINKHGRLVVETVYDFIESFKYGFAVVGTRGETASNDNLMVIDKWGTVLYSGYKNIERMKSGFLGTTTDKSYEIMDYDGNIIKITNSYSQMDNAGEYFDLLAGLYFDELDEPDQHVLVKGDLLNNKGEIIFADITEESNIEFGFDFYNLNIYLVKKMTDQISLERLIPAGETITFDKYEIISIFDDRMVVRKENSFGLGVIDMAGNILIDFDYDRIQLTADDYAIVRANNKWGILDCDGNVILPIEYESIYAPSSETIDF